MPFARSRVTMEPSSTPGASTSNSHLSYPSASSLTSSKRPASPSPPPAPPVREVSKFRLYVGNLHPTVDEYTFIRVFGKYGKIAKLDFLFHKTGQSKGKPRGYAFVEYHSKENALQALVNANGKLLRGKKITVTYAKDAPSYDDQGHGPGRFHRRNEAQRPTALSLIKATSQPGRTQDKIVALEAKLQQMEKSSEKVPSTLPSHPSLPLKPVAAQAHANAAADIQPPSSNNRREPSSTNKIPDSMSAHAKAKRASLFSSGKGPSLGKKPTVDELLQSRKSNLEKSFLKLPSLPNT